MPKRSPYPTTHDAHVLAQIMLEADPSDFDLEREVTRMTTFSCPDCGSTNTSAPDGEGLVDCSDCGIWFNPYRARNRHALNGERLPEAMDDIDPQPSEGPDDYLLDPDAFIEYAMQHGALPRIRTSYNVVTPESAEQGDFAESGWEDEEGETFELDEWDKKEGITLPQLVVKWLNDKGASEASSTNFHPGVWYSSHSEHDDASTIEYNYHLDNFTPKDEAAVYRLFHQR